MTDSVKKMSNYNKNHLASQNNKNKKNETIQHEEYCETTDQPRSLIFIFEKLKNKISQLVLKPHNTILNFNSMRSIQKFKEKFKTNANEWFTLITRIKKQLVNIDKKYFLNDFFGLREMIINQVSNIVISFILIGPNTSTGPGIDNCDAPSILILNQNYMKDYNSRNSIAIGYNQLKTNRQKISEMIDVFLLKLPLNMEIIANSYNIINELNVKYHICQEKIKNINADPDFIVNGQEYHNNLKMELKHLLNLKTKNFESIENKICELLKILKFNHYKHTDWCNLLDQELTLKHEQ